MLSGIKYAIYERWLWLLDKIFPPLNDVPIAVDDEEEYYG